MTRYSADAVIEELTDFQRRSVEHVVSQLYKEGAGRFLVADETGLGKSMVARGVIARAIEHLQDEPTVRRIDIVYVCANTDLAQQNLRRLNVTEDETISFSSRLTLLGKHSSQLKKRGTAGKPVNLVSFTPGTSFDMGHSTGMSEERAMLLLALQECTDLTGYRRTAAERLLQGNVRKLKRFRWTIDELARHLGERGIDRAILSQFRKNVRRGGTKGLLRRFETLVDQMGRKRTIPEELKAEQWRLIRKLRETLAQASVETLEPDLVILDEFQRFRHLLDIDHPAGELANHLFNYPAAKVLLLSATPYKPFTYAEEREDEHATDFHRTLRFLAEGNPSVEPAQIRSDLDEYRRQVISGKDPRVVADGIRRKLLRVMSRQERPILPEGTMSVERVRTASRVSADDLIGYADLQNVARLVGHENDRGLVTAEYWKSAPYFVNFCDGYQLGARVKADHITSDAVAALGRTQHIRAGDCESFLQLDAGNARMRDLVDSTIGRDLWKLLWIPPSLPYLKPGGPYADAADVTKMLVFSSWAATPPAVASLLSYEAERRAAAGTNYTAYTPEVRRRLTKPLTYSMSRGRPGRMTTLMVFWPMPGLARGADPLAFVAETGGTALSRSKAKQLALGAISRLLDSGQTDRQAADDNLSSDVEESSWKAAFSMSASWPRDEFSDDEVAMSVRALSGEREERDEENDAPLDLDGLQAHVEAARAARAEGAPPPSAETLDLLAQVALHSPANIAFRALGRILEPRDNVTSFEHFVAAAALANGLRSLFNRPDVTKLLEQVTDSDLPYWHKVLQYCAFGNLQSVLDEYLHHLRHDQYQADLDSQSLFGLTRMAASAMSLRSTTYQAIDVDNLEDHLRFIPRFALRYGGRRQNAEDARQPEVRNSFNSPFWPFVLTSTSVGQEGIDFHWWCHSVFHWNTPANPVDFEQREGRVDRYRGHAVRRNIAARHSQRILAAPGNDPWARAFEIADDYCSEYGDFTPSWVYPGPAKVQRHVAPFALSSDEEKYQRIKQDVALYRLAFGQPRQEDMMDLLRQRGLDADPNHLLNMRIDLAP
ncbi:DEAD/DEAH box helicase [Rhodococcus sp. CSLK01-03]|uniref:DEAD/DEAH box helicase n=1 Tax=Rhodococcus indonesiensis TaxID=3055869 RepID=A0ABT7RQB6_9NOCA|nr:DEAD/DEAH box helicase [Rhodococcus indonesiensis]MDM7489842.1 DEAD/DEAH box helicase [Rhodococcus indonesiensis]